jgi:MoaA/NifB/PqqE/SkfB family radical SAM enzyme
MGQYHDYDSLREMHVEITNKCNAACPMCSRNVNGGALTPGLSLTEWSVDDARKCFDPRFKNLRNILFCGTHGDPAAAQHTLSILEVLKQRHPHSTTEFYSNGGVRDQSWWQDLGQLLNSRISDNHYRSSDLAIFSVDGLEDTNHIYRRKTQFSKIMANAEAFIKAGGVARWDFLVFKHNQHQVEEAQALAKKMGFKHFRVRKTSRFAYSPDGPDKYPVLGKEGNIEYYLEPPVEKDYKNTSQSELQKFVTDIQKNQPVEIKQIKCLYKNEFNRIYVNAQMAVYPCCFISSSSMPGQGKVRQDVQKNVTQRLGPHFNSLRTKSWDEILDHPWFAHELVESWKTPKTTLLQCQKTCGLKVSPILSQSQDVSP